MISNTFSIRISKTIPNKFFIEYPTEKEKFVRKINLIEEKTDPAREIIYRKRVAECENVIPRIMRTIGVLNEKAILLEEESWFFLRQNHLEVKSQNLTWCQYAHLREQSTFRTHENNPNWTVFEQHGSIDVHGIGPLGNVMEMFAQRFLQMGVKRSLAIMEDLLKEKYIASGNLR